MKKPKVPNFNEKVSTGAIIGDVFRDGGNHDSSAFSTFNMGEIVAVHDTYSYDVALFKGKTVLKHIPCLSPFMRSEKGQGIYAIPELGSKCIVSKSDQDWFILGFIPHPGVEGTIFEDWDDDEPTKVRQLKEKLGVDTSRDPSSNVSSGPPTYATKEMLKERFFQGDLVRKTRAGNKSVLFSTGDIVHFATHLAQRIYSKSKETIVDFCRNFSFQTPSVSHQITTDDTGGMTETKSYKNMVSDELPTYIDSRGTGVDFILKRLFTAKTGKIRWFWNLSRDGITKSGGRDEEGKDTWVMELTNKGSFAFKNFFAGKPLCDVGLSDTGRFVIELRGVNGKTQFREFHDPAQNKHVRVTGDPDSVSNTKNVEVTFGRKTDTVIGERNMLSTVSRESVQQDKTVSVDGVSRIQAGLGYEIGIAPITLVPNIIASAVTNNTQPMTVDMSAVPMNMTTGGLTIANSNPLLEQIVFGEQIYIPSLPVTLADAALGNLPKPPEGTPGVARVGDPVQLPFLEVYAPAGSILDSFGLPCTIVPPGVAPPSQGSDLTLPVRATPVPNALSASYAKIFTGSTRVFAG